jgi:hypothetical protein
VLEVEGGRSQRKGLVRYEGSFAMRLRYMYESSKKKALHLGSIGVLAKTVIFNKQIMPDLKTSAYPPSSIATTIVAGDYL